MCRGQAGGMGKALLNLSLTVLSIQKVQSGLQTRTGCCCCGWESNPAVILTRDRVSQAKGEPVVVQNNVNPQKGGSAKPIW